MITFKKIPSGTINTKTGEVTGIGTPKEQPRKPANVGIPYEELRDQILALATKKTPIEQAFKAIDAHPEIKDKVRAKSMAQAMYTILESSGKQKKVVQ